MLAALLGLMLCACSKKDDKPKEATHSVTYTLYSAHTPYVFGHNEDANISSPIDTIRTNAYSVTLQVKDNALDFYQYVQSVNKYPTDSLFIKASYEGKSVQESHKVGSSIFSIHIQLSAAK
jgi:hypothetical protein